MASSLLRLRPFNIAFNGRYKLPFVSGSVLCESDFLKRNTYPHQTSCRNMSVDLSITNIDINGVKKFQNDPSATIVDVREVKEIQETGKLPGSVNIPLGTLSKILQEDNEKFQKTFNRPKPLVDNPIVFSCRSGRRSFMASEAAVALGYKKVFNYQGGWLDWNEHCGKSETC